MTTGTPAVAAVAPVEEAAVAVGWEEEAVVAAVQVEGAAWVGAAMAADAQAVAGEWGEEARAEASGRARPACASFRSCL